MKKVAKTIKKHLWGILNAIVLKVSNGPAEGINSRIKAIKVRSHGFRTASASTGARADSREWRLAAGIPTKR